MGIIKILDTQTADKIAAGEVIERPLSVVKELLENSIDAGSDFIEIEIKDGGVGLIAVRDNGCGMDKEDLEIAFVRHSTSKMQKISDLNKLSSLGFRGEALASITAVSQVEMTSALKGSTLGHKISLTGGSIPTVIETAATGGTKIEVKNLFYNIPARRKFLKSQAYESGLIGELVSKYALGHPQIRFRLINNRQLVLDTAKMTTTEERMCYFYGADVREAIITVPKIECAPARFLEMYLLRETVSRNNRSQEIFFVNGRLIKSSALSLCLEEGYHTLLSKGRFPIAVVNLTLPGEQIDVNIHPSKLEIKINDFDSLKKALVEYVRDALWQAGISKNAFLLEDYRPKNTTNESFVAHLPLQEPPYGAKVEARSVSGTLSAKGEYPSLAEIKKKISAKEQFLEKNDSLKKEELPPEKAQDTKLPLQKQLFTANSASNIAKNGQVAAFKQAETESAKVKDLEGLTLLGQLNNSFILAQNKEGLYIIDQHTLHERILYERFSREVENQSIISENLLIPVNFNLTPKQENIFIQYIVQLRDLGFVIEDFGERSYLLRAVPMGLAHSDNLNELIWDLIEDLGAEKNITMAVLKEAVINQAACKGAIKAREKLDEKEMLDLLAALDKVDNAHTCPHGRPIFYKISMSELYGIFKRGAYPYD